MISVKLIRIFVLASIFIVISAIFVFIILKRSGVSQKQYGKLLLWVVGSLCRFFFAFAAAQYLQSHYNIDLYDRMVCEGDYHKSGSSRHPRCYNAETGSSVHALEVLLYLFLPQIIYTSVVIIRSKIRENEKHHQK